MALPAALPALSHVAAVPVDVKDALPALTVMLVNGGVNIMIAVLILIAGWIIARWVGRWAHGVVGHSAHVDETLKPLIVNFARYGILAITTVAVLSQFGVQTTSLIALLGAAGLAIGLALQGTLSNVASGVMLLFLRPFRVNEHIKTNDVTGTVREIGLFRTVIVTDDGVYVTVPNATIFAATIANTSREAARRADVTVEIDRSEDLDAVEKTIFEALAREPRVLQTPAPAVEVTTLGPISTTLSVQVWVANGDFGKVPTQVKKAVRRALQGVAAPVPVPAPAVAPWTPPAEAAKPEQGTKPN